MSGANAIHGIILVGAIIVAGQAAHPWELAVALLAVVLATANLVGGFVVTDRMLEMFRGNKAKKQREELPAGDASGIGALPSGGVPSETRASETRTNETPARESKGIVQ
jgi:NAD(P) transhydrogenase subunit alpha